MAAFVKRTANFLHHHYHHYHHYHCSIKTDCMPCWGNCADSLLQIKEKKKKKVHLRPHVTICDRASLKGSQDRRALAVPVTPVHRTVKQRNPERETVRACNESVRACERQPELCWDCCCYCCCSHWRVNVRACKERKKKKKKIIQNQYLRIPGPL